MATLPVFAWSIPWTEDTKTVREVPIGPMIKHEQHAHIIHFNVHEDKLQHCR